MTEMTDTTATPRGERTREATDRKLMRATLQIAVDRGISGVTIEEVARRSGVAKTTIHWLHRVRPRRERRRLRALQS